MLKNKKRIAALLCVLSLASCSLSAAAYGDNKMQNPFKSEKSALDINLDGAEDIRDLLRLKKYAAGINVTANLSIFSDTGIERLPFCAEHLSLSLEQNSWETVSAKFVNPLKAAHSGISASSADGKEHAHDDADIYVNNIYVSATFSEPFTCAQSDGLIFYVKTDAANSVIPAFTVSDPTVTGYDPDESLAVGAVYSYRQLGDSVWSSARTTKSGFGKDGYFFGLITFDTAFEGFIKIPYQSLSNDMIGNPDEENLFKRFVVKFKGIGGQYGSAVAGPVYRYSDDTVDNAEGKLSASGALVVLKKNLLNIGG